MADNSQYGTRLSLQTGWLLLRVRAALLCCSRTARPAVIRAVCDVGDLPADADVVDFGDRALLPGLVDSHVHINEPGRTEWEGFATATRAAAAGGYTTLVDMPLNCLPETTTVAALEVKRLLQAPAAREGKPSAWWIGQPGAAPSRTIRPICFPLRAPEFPASSASSSTPAATASP